MSGQFLASSNVPNRDICPPTNGLSNHEQFSFDRAQLVNDLHMAYLKGDYIETYDRYIDLAVFDEYEGGNAECFSDIFRVFREQEPFRKDWLNFLSSLAEFDPVILRRFFAEAPINNISLPELRLIFQSRAEAYDEVHEEAWMITFIQKLKAGHHADELRQLAQLQDPDWPDRLRQKASEALKALEKENTDKN